MFVLGENRTHNTYQRSRASQMESDKFIVSNVIFIDAEVLFRAINVNVSREKQLNEHNLQGGNCLHTSKF